MADDLIIHVDFDLGNGEYLVGACPASGALLPPGAFVTPNLGHCPSCGDVVRVERTGHVPPHAPKEAPDDGSD